ncbi:hypothetical protein RDV64_04205 [Acuticoccus sp. MNP-M23]|uniref:hypothetical protein n=1 Tax=Acuticoccus sp. MNP-M23 TaxID=3072793 RepID=UPI0028163B05|nr:hypothetical protein [Acuticoccus sp. MNP-M23]WMS43612.1 hypothetical protein RDV64_04205 [Acuticoccus sp. MNP-M23]
MLSAAEINRSLRGAWLLFLGREEGLQALDRSVDGFWRSFAVIVLVLPLTAISVVAVTRGDPDRAFSDIFLSQIPLLLLDWVIFPLVMALVARPLGVSAHYVSYVVARNWAAPITAAILTVPLVLEGAGFLPVEGANLLSIIALLMVLYYHFRVLRLALKTPVSLSIGLVVADFCVTMVLIGMFG